MIHVILSYVENFRTFELTDPLLMDSKRAARIKQGLSQYDFKYTIVASAPVVGTFTDLRRCIDHFPYPAAVSALKLFKLDTLTQSKEIKSDTKRKALTRLVSLLGNVEFFG